MNDIVSRLTAAANGDRSWRAGLLKDAAREIRRLRDRTAQGMQLREDSRSEAEAEGLQPGPKDAPNPCYSPTPVSEEVRK